MRAKNRFDTFPAAGNVTSGDVSANALRGDIVDEAYRLLGELEAGEVCSAPRYDRADLHLQGLEMEFPWITPSEMAHKLAARLAPQPPNPSDLIKWPGDLPETMPPARAMLAADQQIFTAQEENEALFFHDGDQWDQIVKTHRKNAGRPVLTVNRIPLLVAASIAADPESHLSAAPGRALSGDQQAMITRLKIIITRRNMDAQRFYNFMCSNAAEMASIKHQTIEGVDTVIDSNGTVHGKPLTDLRGIRT